MQQNYPNPFWSGATSRSAGNPVTSIQFAVASEQVVSLKVYDVNGREVATLVDEKKPAGHYRVVFEARNLPSGIYFYRLRAGDFAATHKMLLVR